MKKAVKAAVVSVAAAGALVGGFVVSGLVAATANEGTSLAEVDGYHGDDKFEVNENGQTFGSSMDASSAENEPDLILAYGLDSDGKMVMGYVTKLDLMGPPNLTVDEAIALQEKQGSGDRQIPLYAEDGKTVIGTFTLTGGNEVAVSADK